MENEKNFGEKYPQRAMTPPRNNMAPDPKMGAVYAGPIINSTMMVYAGPEQMSGGMVPPIGFTTINGATGSGNADTEMIFCSMCGAKMPKKGKFCPECGTVNKER